MSPVLMPNLIAAVAEDDLVHVGAWGNGRLARCRSLRTRPMAEGRSWSKASALVRLGDDHGTRRARALSAGHGPAGAAAAVGVESLA
jgi:hypothetical protein